MISIVGLDKAEVLATLYNHACTQGVGEIHFDPRPMTREEAVEFLKRDHYFDYLKGRVMKIDLSSNDSFWPGLYDRDNGPGAAAKVPDEYRSRKGGDQ